MSAEPLSTAGDVLSGRPPVQFVLPPDLEARQPAERRGLRRDNVRLMVLPRFDGAAVHTRFDALEDYLLPGDLLVVNNSRTLPALLQAGDESGQPVEVRLANRRAEDTWDVLLLDGRTHVGRPGMALAFGEGLSAQIIARCPGMPFLWQMQFSRCCMQLLDLIYRLGEPVHYDYLENRLPLDLYQTVYAVEPGSVEMPSAGRPFTWEMLIRLQKKGVGLAAITLHTGLSSSRDDAADAAHPIHPESYRVSAEAAAAVNATRQRGGRVIAVGTSVVRTLETIAQPDGSVQPAGGVTDLRITTAHPLRAVDALLTGMHEPQASHLDLLSAFVEPQRLQAAYLEAIQRGYLWHEFGDTNLII